MSDASGHATSSVGAPGRPTARVRTPRGRAAPRGVGGRRRGPARAAPRRGEGRPARRRLPRGGRRRRAVTCSTRWRCRRRSSRRAGPPGWPRRCSPAGSRCRTWRAHGDARADRRVRPADARRREDRRAGGHRARRRLRRRGHPHRRAERDGDRYVVNGAKTFITSGVRADFVTTAVRTGGPGHAGVSLLVVEKGTPGFTVDRGWTRWAGTARTPPSCPSSTCGSRPRNLVGEENAGFHLIAEQFVVERIALAVHAYGIAARSLALTAAYCRERETFGKPLISRQVVQHKLVEMHRQVEVARTYTREVAAPPRAGEQTSSPRPAWPSTPPSRRATTSSTRPCSCTAAPATCTGPRWSGTTATPGSWASEEERPKC